MLQLVLGISLSVILLFVIALLVTEVAAAYPSSGRYDGQLLVRFNEFMFRNTADRNKARLLLIVLSCIIALCLTAYFVTERSEIKAETPPNMVAGKQQVTPVQPQPMITNAIFRDTVPEYSMSVVSRSKWDGGKIYCNNSITFNDKAIWSFKDWSFYFLDKEGYLIKKVSFTLEDLVFEYDVDGRITGLMGRFNGDLSLQEYQKIQKVDLILDNKSSPVGE